MSGPDKKADFVGQGTVRVYDSRPEKIVKFRIELWSENYEVWKNIKKNSWPALSESAGRECHSRRKSCATCDGGTAAEKSERMITAHIRQSFKTPSPFQSQRWHALRSAIAPSAFPTNRMAQTNSPPTITTNNIIIGYYLLKHLTFPVPKINLDNPEFQN